MKKINFNNKLIVAKCSYCGSGNVGMANSPVWTDGAWKLPVSEGGASGVGLFVYSESRIVKSEYNRTFCLDCEGDTNLTFKVSNIGEESDNDSHSYIADVTEKISDGDGGFDYIYFKRKFNSMKALEGDLLLQLWDENCDIKVSKILSDDDQWMQKNL